jgi:hypothetical protein
MACVRIGIAVANAERKKNRQFVDFAVETLMETIEKTSNPSQLRTLAGALKAVPIAPTEAQRIFARLIAIMERSTDPGQLWALAEALKAVPGEPAPAEAQRAFTQLITIMKRSTDPGQLRALAGASKAVVGRLARAEAQRAFAQLITIMERDADLELLEALVGALKAVPADVDRKILIDLLKWPTSVGVLRATLLEMVERGTIEKFGGNLWTMVTWAQKNGLDVKSPPKRPDK